MTRIINILTFIFVGIFILSLTGPMVSVDYWDLKYNDSTLLFSHISREDTTLVLDCKKIKATDSVRYSYHPCFHDDNINYITRLYIVTPKNKQFLLTEQKSKGFWFGNFSAKTLQKIADSCDVSLHCTTCCVSLHCTTCCSIKDVALAL